MILTNKLFLFQKAIAANGLELRDMEKPVMGTDNEKKPPPSAKDKK